jgi:hypothetical protein
MFFFFYKSYLHKFVGDSKGAKMTVLQAIPKWPTAVYPSVEVAVDALSAYLRYLPAQFGLTDRKHQIWRF